MSSRATTWWLAGIVLAGLALRVFGLGWGLPDLHHPDELTILNRALTFAKGDFNPHLFLYPTLYYYALFFWEGATFVAGYLTGVWNSVDAFEKRFFLDPSRVVLAGRLLTALLGTATLVAVYRFGTRLYDRATGVAAAVLLAVAPFAVRDAHYIKHDVPVTLFIVLSQAAVARLVADAGAAARRRTWLAAGVFAGLAISTHYYAFPVIVPIVVVAVLEVRRTGAWREMLGRLALAGVATIAGFLAASPFFLKEFGTVVRDMTAVRQIDLDRAVSTTGAFSSLSAYLSMLATDAAGRATAAAAVVGVTVAVLDNRRRALVLLAFPIAFLALLANTVPMSRYVNPLLPSLAVAAALALTRLFKTWPRWLWVGVVAIALPGLAASVRADNFYRQVDTRTLARQFIEQVAPAGSTVLVQPHSVQLRPSREGLVEALRVHLGTETRASIKFQKQLAAASSMSPVYRVLYLGKTSDGGFDPEKLYVAPEELGDAAGLQPLRDRRVAYVALNRYNDGTSAFASMDAALQREAKLLATFSPYRESAGPDQRAATAPFFHNTADRIDPALERPGPIVEIWQLK